MLFLCINNLLLNIISNNAPILKDKYSIFLKEVMEVLYDNILHKQVANPSKSRIAKPHQNRDFLTLVKSTNF